MMDQNQNSILSYFLVLEFFSGAKITYNPDKKEYERKCRGTWVA